MDSGNIKINTVLERINASLVNIIIFSIGVFTVLASFFAKSSHWKSILISIGCSLMASCVVSYLTSKYLIRVSRIKRIINYWGLEAIYETRQEMNQSADTAFKILEDNLDIIAWGLKSFRDAKNKVVIEKVKRGLKIRIIAPDPDSEYVQQREKDEKEVKGQIKQTIINLTKWLEGLRLVAPDSSNIQIKYYNKLPEIFISELISVFLQAPIFMEYQASKQYLANSEEHHTGLLIIRTILKDYGMTLTFAKTGLTMLPEAEYNHRILVPR